MLPPRAGLNVAAMRDPILHEILMRRGAVTKLAEACGISKAAVSQWRHVPHWHVETVAAALGMDPAQIRPDLAEEYRR